MAVWGVWFVLVGSHSSELRIDHRLFFQIQDFIRMVLIFFKIFSQPYELVGKPNQPVH